MFAIDRTSSTKGATFNFCLTIIFFTNFRWATAIMLHLLRISFIKIVRLGERNMRAGKLRIIRDECSFSQCRFCVAFSPRSLFVLSLFHLSRGSSVPRTLLGVLFLAKSQFPCANNANIKCTRLCRTWRSPRCSKCMNENGKEKKRK